MIALYIVLYLVAGVLTGGGVYTWYLKGVADNADKQMTVVAAVLAWPVPLSIALIAGTGWLLFKGAEWFGVLVKKRFRGRSRFG